MNFTGLDLTSSDWEDSCIELPDQRMQYECQLMNLMSKNSPKFICHICHKVFTTRRRRDTHVETHSDVRNLYSCPKCDRKFTWVDSLRRHIKIVHFLNN
ncbi:hypothetical protein TNCV_24631 [Trichonephila clavipes]|uniref:C2H2-type domain-containing protein n=1 Tax=Trichonephila clavipes TaxID=2585209 RepID=A0A8X6W195_TRICX|nr:hypothetical protein TNCV_24631 [Trichonephila clavipes]